jgi:hypothetical protein
MEVDQNGSFVNHRSRHASTVKLEPIQNTSLALILVTIQISKIVKVRSGCNYTDVVLKPRLRPPSSASVSSNMSIQHHCASDIPSRSEHHHLLATEPPSILSPHPDTTNSFLKQCMFAAFRIPNTRHRHTLPICRTATWIQTRTAHPSRSRYPMPSAQVRSGPIS